jgi:autotransporter passenger strand-loop-strand repeat protein
VYSGGLADPATIYGGGSETISSGGIDLGARISGGAQYDYGFASGVGIFAGSQVVESGGTASAGFVSSGGTLVVSSGGRSVSATLDGSGIASVSAGGTASSEPQAGPRSPAAGSNTSMPAGPRPMPPSSAGCRCCSGW